MVIFHSYVSLPQGNKFLTNPHMTTTKRVCGTMASNHQNRVRSIPKSCLKLGYGFSRPGDASEFLGLGHLWFPKNLQTTQTPKVSKSFRHVTMFHCKWSRLNIVKTETPKQKLVCDQPAKRTHPGDIDSESESNHFAAWQPLTAGNQTRISIKNSQHKWRS